MPKKNVYNTIFTRVLEETANIADFEIDLQPLEYSIGSTLIDYETSDSVLKKVSTNKTDIGVAPMVLFNQKEFLVQFSKPIYSTRLNFYLKSDDFGLTPAMYFKVKFLKFNLKNK